MEKLVVGVAVLGLTVGLFGAGCNVTEQVNTEEAVLVMDADQNPAQMPSKAGMADKAKTGAVCPVKSESGMCNMAAMSSVKANTPCKVKGAEGMMNCVKAGKCPVCNAKIAVVKPHAEAMPQNCANRWKKQCKLSVAEQQNAEDGMVIVEQRNVFVPVFIPVPVPVPVDENAAPAAPAPAKEPAAKAPAAEKTHAPAAK
ncbi:MAG: hypothetical protein PHS41_05265 [Victivallaceae bacterium]|nr:hypothetical protein [Victivallaceae bacterium]